MAPDMFVATPHVQYVVFRKALSQHITPCA